MKIKLYFIQEILNSEQPHDCVGELFVYSSEDARNRKIIILDEYHDYIKFEKEIELYNDQ